ncbi:hypothetical protein [Nevskia sp.]|uniref:hypothetical protein n=1 Tax=Nevskia sp. TaxID=1929292 RepID=UPI0025D5ADF8|nr:hypothetical protein [Nevskia sp.]
MGNPPDNFLVPDAGRGPAQHVVARELGIAFMAVNQPRQVGGGGHGRLCGVRAFAGIEASPPGQPERQQRGQDDRKPP